MTVADVLVVGSGLAAIAAGRRLLDAGRSVALVELGSERPVRTMFRVDPTALAERALSGLELDGLFFRPGVAGLSRHAPGLAPELTFDEGTFRLRDGETTVVHATQLVIAPAPGDLAIPDIPDARALVGYGVSACAWSDGTFFTDPVLVVGDGDFAYESALFAAMTVREVVLVRGLGAAGKRASLREAVERSARVRVETGTSVVAVSVAGQERLRVEVQRGTTREESEWGGVVFAAEPRYGEEALQIAQFFDGAPLEGKLAYAGGLAGIDDHDHAALVRDGFRAAAVLLAGA